MPIRPFFPLLLFTLLLAASAAAQDNYEIQVYGAETVAPGRTMVELHSNYTLSGSKQNLDGILPTQHAVHETVEITQGITPWFETGFYIFTSYNPAYGYQWVGDHLRPRVRAPEQWHWPVGASLSMEVGYQRHAFSADTWTWEIRPIVDKQLGKLYLAFNTTLDRSFHGPSVALGVSFSPNFKVGYDLTKRINAGLEYYGSLGPVTGFDPFRDQQQQIIPAIDLNLGPNWEFNFGVGVGVTHSTDHLLVKVIVGRRFGFGAR
ncbi:MAG: transporter, partial [Acidobacteriota bacterium]|nr:transporter [Acidobacteriota bacterium]